MTRPGRASARLVLATLAATILVACAPPERPEADRPAPRAPQVSSFALIGDMPYGAGEVHAFRRLQRAIDAAPVDFVVHVGDIKSGIMPCTEGMYRERRALLDAFAHPVFYVPGDNEWTDCHRLTAGIHDPLDRLALLRRTFATKTRSLGRRTLPLERQAREASAEGLPENVRWRYRDIVFAGLHVVGSHNGRGRDARGDAEVERRMAANLAWLRDAFTRARRDRARAVVVVMHANPRFGAAPDSAAGRAYGDLLAALRDEVLHYDGPVVLVHGDTHHHRVDHPLEGEDGEPLRRFTRVEVFGSPDLRWVEAIVDPDTPGLFRFEPRDGAG